MCWSSSRYARTVIARQTQTSQIAIPKMNARKISTVMAKNAFQNASGMTIATPNNSRSVKEATVAKTTSYVFVIFNHPRHALPTKIVMESPTRWGMINAVAGFGAHAVKAQGKNIAVVLHLVVQTKNAIQVLLLLLSGTAENKPLLEEHLLCHPSHLRHFHCLQPRKQRLLHSNHRLLTTQQIFRVCLSLHRHRRLPNHRLKHLFPNHRRVFQLTNVDQNHLLN